MTISPQVTKCQHISSVPREIILRTVIEPSSLYSYGLARYGDSEVHRTGSGVIVEAEYDFDGILQTRPE